MSKPDNPSAFPIPPAHIFPSGDISVAEEGMSLRDWFAGNAMAGYISSNEYGPMTGAELAEHSYAQADAMLAEREKKP